MLTLLSQRRVLHPLIYFLNKLVILDTSQVQWLDQQKCIQRNYVSGLLIQQQQVIITEDDSYMVMKSNSTRKIPFLCLFWWFVWEINHFWVQMCSDLLLSNQVLCSIRVGRKSGRGLSFGISKLSPPNTQTFSGSESSIKHNLDSCNNSAIYCTGPGAYCSSSNFVTLKLVFKNLFNINFVDILWFQQNPVRIFWQHFVSLPSGNVRGVISVGIFHYISK